MTYLIDSHAHIHFKDFDEDRDQVVQRAGDAGVTKIITVGTNEIDSDQALAVSRTYDNVWFTVGLHPNDADRGHGALQEIARQARLDKVVAIGECGLDYYRQRTSPEQQEKALRFQIELARELNLPLSFHVRDAFDDFWAILDDYSGARGVVHCFTAGSDELRAALDRGLYVALNGIMTFTKEEYQLEAARELPLDRLLLETDAPYLAPAPARGRRNEPANVVPIADFLARLRGETVAELAAATTANAERLFGI
jgi:TatD DNase family protein